MEDLQKWIKAAKSDENVWIADVREKFNASSECRKLNIVLTMFDGTVRRFPCSIPEGKTPEEMIFLTEYVASSVYNMLSALGGKSVSFEFSAEDAFISEIVSNVREHLAPAPSGFGRIVSETQRIQRLAGAIGKCLPEDAAENPDLPHLMCAAAEKTMHGVWAGIDIGGTDIKLIASKNGRIAGVLEYDWNPASYQTAEKITGPVMELAKKLLAVTGSDAFDGIGLSFPDVVINDRICGGETPKTQGLRKNINADYETEFEKVAALSESLKLLLAPGGKIALANDGSVAAFTSAVETAFSEEPSAVCGGVFSHAMGTSLGSGWIDSNGNVPPIPLEFYDSVIDLGSWKKRKISPEDLRSVCSNSGNVGVDRFVGQASAFRYAWEINPSLLEKFTEETDGCIYIKASPKDLRKPCLEHLMTEAEGGNPDAEEVFLRIGEALGQISREIIYYLHPATCLRRIFGRFVRYPHVFELIRKGTAKTAAEITLLPADESAAFSPLMRQLAAREDITVAQFGQAVGAVYMAGKAEITDKK